MTTLLPLLAIALATILCICNTLPLVSANEHEISQLPGYQNKIPFRQYAGYLPGTKTHDAQLFYWFVESQNDPANDPVVLWMNGGPGCSSLTGFVTEHGPFLINDDGKTLRENAHSWNKVSNVLYLEAPHGVGFSYSKCPLCDLDDDRMADSVYEFLQNFFVKYPQFKKNDFYVSGESYAGHYTPTVSYRIWTQNQEQRDKIVINIKGFLVGNGVTDMEQDSNSTPYFMWQHLMIPSNLFERALKVCDGNFYKNGDKPACARLLSEMWQSIDGVNPYGIYADCEFPPGGAIPEKIKLRGKTLPLHPLTSMFALNMKRAAFLANNRSPSLSAPCINDAPFASYFNNKDVKAAIHARQDTKWEFCSAEVNHHYDWTRESMIPFYHTLIKGGLRVLVFTGDTDLAVNPMGTEYSVMKMNLTVTEEFRTWNVEGSRQVAGWVRNHGPLVFVTVRGAGHMVPTDKPVEALSMYTRFLKNEPF